MRTSTLLFHSTNPEPQNTASKRREASSPPRVSFLRASAVSWAQVSAAPLSEQAASLPVAEFAAVVHARAAEACVAAEAVRSPKEFAAGAQVDSVAACSAAAPETDDHSVRAEPRDDLPPGGLARDGSLAVFRADSAAALETDGHSVRAEPLGELSPGGPARDGSPAACVPAGCPALADSAADGLARTAFPHQDGCPAGSAGCQDEPHLESPVFPEEPLLPLDAPEQP